jgi:enterochelin esterase-like enzyme
MKLNVLIVLSLGSTPILAQSPCKSSVTGDLVVESFQTVAYGKPQTLRIWLPPGYTDAANAKRKYPVLYMLDGQNYFDDCTAFANEREWRVDEAITRLLADNKIEPLIVIGIDSDRERAHQYRPYRDPITDAAAPEPRGKELPAFLANEVLPYVSARYRVTSDAGKTGIGGASLGGVASLYVLLNRPDLFGVGLIESPTLPLGNGQLLRDSEFLARGPDRIYIGVGTTEVVGQRGDEFARAHRLSLTEANAGFARMSETVAKNLKAAYLKQPAILLIVEQNATHGSTSWARRFPQAVTFLYAKP